MDAKYSKEQTDKYVRFAEESFSWRYIEKPLIKQHIKPFVNSHGRILDAGCGSGRSTKLLLDLGFLKKNIVASDISPNMLEIAKKYLKKIKFIESDLNHLKFDGDSFDVIVSNMVLQYLDQKNLVNVMRKFYTWLSSGGYLFCIVVHPFRFPENYAQYFDQKVKKELTPWGTTIEYYPKKISDYVNTIIGSGFELIELSEPQPLLRGKKDNLLEFNKYFSMPTRLVIKAKKT